MKRHAHTAYSAYARPVKENQPIVSLSNDSVTP